MPGARRENLPHFVSLRNSIPSDVPRCADTTYRVLTTSILRAANWRRYASIPPHGASRIITGNALLQTITFPSPQPRVPSLPPSIRDGNPTTAIAAPPHL